jgi:transposase
MAATRLGIRLKGKGRRYRLTSGEEVSYNKYQKLLKANNPNFEEKTRRLELNLAQGKSLEIAVKRAGMSQRDYSVWKQGLTPENNPYEKVKGRSVYKKSVVRFLSYVDTNGRFSGENIPVDKTGIEYLKQWRRAIREGLGFSKYKPTQAQVQSDLDSLQAGFNDRFGKPHKPETNLNNIRSALERMTDSERQEFVDYLRESS